MVGNSCHHMGHLATLYFVNHNVIMTIYNASLSPGNIMLTIKLSQHKLHLNSFIMPVENFRFQFLISVLKMFKLNIYCKVSTGAIL